MQGFVYLIDADGIYKVGRTNDLTSRINLYRYHNPFVRRVYVLVTEAPKQLENYFLVKFFDKRLHEGEDWFKLNEDDVDHFLNYSISEVADHEYQPVDRGLASSKTHFERAEEVIVQILSSETKELNQTQLRSSLIKNGFTDTTARLAIAAMQTKGLLEYRDGRRNSKVYFLHSEE